ncbi:YesL family protein [Jiangella mangrovi]|uniref:Putative membrane protein YesL n=1 Tax=Jiangella mangrovi TaxID=1524084 RepID=A0A7W9LJ27_9ACTN|nr:YesL family protein [Jiangella mangrovi]MBB5785650.1 putative membrane protein YesL [Jiangella mangrovi]
MAEVRVGGRYGRLYGWLDWPARLAGLNLLWLLGVLAGLVLFGLAPATAALYAVLRGYVLDRSPRMWRDFWAVWRASLVSSQPVLGLPILTVWVVVFYLLLSRSTPFAWAMAVVAAGYLATLLQLPAVVAHLDLPVVRSWQVTAEVAWRRPLPTLGVAVLVAGLAAGAWSTTPAALPLLFPALPALLATLTVQRGLSP